MRSFSHICIYHQPGGVYNKYEEKKGKFNKNKLQIIKKQNQIRPELNYYSKINEITKLA